MSSVRRPRDTLLKGVPIATADPCRICQREEGCADHGDSARSASLYNEDLGAEPPVEFRAEPLVLVRSQKLKAFCPFSYKKCGPNVKDLN